MKKILIACDKFKGSLSASQACAAIASGIENAGCEVEVRMVPIADGGEGMSSSITQAKAGEWLTRTVTGPMGAEVEAGFGMIHSTQTAVIEMAEASGLEKVGANQNDPWRATTYGTGQLIQHACELGAQSILLGIGGSATNDGGAGMAAALGYRFVGSDAIPDSIGKCQAILPPDDRLWPQVTVACDVSNPLLGPQGCTRIYGPQKGVKQSDFEKHEARLSRLVELLGADLLATQPGSGAAGGLGFGSLAFLNATLVPGFQLVAQALDLESHLKWADWVITGEGKIDGQSIQGKAPFGMAQMASSLSKPTYAFCGICSEVDLRDQFAGIIEIDRGNHSHQVAMQKSAELLAATAESWFRLRG